MTAATLDQRARREQRDHIQDRLFRYAVTAAALFVPACDVCAGGGGAL